MEIIKRSIMLKCSTEENIDELFENVGINVTRTLQHISDIIEQFQRQPSSEKGKCSNCTEEKNLTYRKGQELWCTSCFMKQWSQFTLQGEFKQSLVKLEPKFAMHGYYYGAIIVGIDIVKSYLAKKEKRDNEIAKAKENCVALNAKLEGYDGLNFKIEQTKALIRKGKMLNKELAQLENEKEKVIREFKQNMNRARRKPISFPIFNNNQIYLGSIGMFKFEKAENSYQMKLSHYKLPKHKISFNLKIGDLRKYHKKCKSVVEIRDNLFYCKKCGFVPKLECHLNFQEQFIAKCIENNEHKIVYPKMIRRKIQKGYEYYFMFPTRDITSISSKEMEKRLKDKNTELCCISFGIKKPATLIIIKNNKIKLIKTFGNGTLYHKNELDRKTRANIFNGIGQKYSHNHPHNDDDKQKHQHKRISLKKVGRKIGFKLRRFVNYYNQKLTHDIIEFIKERCELPLIIFRDTKNIKDISYKGELMRRLSRWSIEQQKTFLKYKSYLNNIPIYKLPYKETSNLRCSRCGEETKEKVTTSILKFEKDFKCENCKYNNYFYANDALNLYVKVKEAKA